MYHTVSHCFTLFHTVSHCFTLSHLLPSVRLVSNPVTTWAQILTHLLHSWVRLLPPAHSHVTLSPISMTSLANCLDMLLHTCHMEHLLLLSEALRVLGLLNPSHSFLLSLPNTVRLYLWSLDKRKNMVSSLPSSSSSLLPSRLMDVLYQSSIFLQQCETMEPTSLSTDLLQSHDSSLIFHLLYPLCYALVTLNTCHTPVTLTYHTSLHTHMLHNVMYLSRMSHVSLSLTHL